MKKIERIDVKMHDNQRKNTGDCVSTESDNALPRGRVRIFEKNENGLYLLEDTSNLIVFRGRNWLMQRAFNQNLGNNGDQGGSGGQRTWKDYYINWFAIGTGGAETGSMLDVSSPELSNIELATHGVIGTDGKNVSGKEYMSFDDGFPQYLNDPDLNNDGIPNDAEDERLYDALPDVTPIYDPVRDDYKKPDSFLVAKIQVTLGADDANGGDTDNDFQDLNEAGLFVSDDHVDPQSDPQLFARVTFSTIRKTNMREIVFSWYIYF